MERRKLGRSGIEVSPLGMGCWAIGGSWQFTQRDGTRGPAGWGQIDDAESFRAIHRAIDLGINFFDTAANYGCGHSERVLGKALADRRDRVAIATKFGFIVDETTKIVTYNDAAVISNLRKDCEASLRRLNTDYIDLYQLHVSDYGIAQAAALRDALEVLVREGKIRAYGWSTDDAGRARVFAEGEHCAAVQHGFNIFWDAPEVLALCDERDMASVNRTPLGMGMLTGKFKADTTFPEDDVRRRMLDLKGEQGQRRLRGLEAIRAVLMRGGRTLAQGALGWIWARSERTIPIPGFKTVRQVEENAGAMQFGPLSGAQLLEIQSLLESVESPA